MRFKAVVCAVVALMLGAATLHAQNVVYATPFNAPEEFRQWYHKMEQCTGLKGDFKQLYFAVVDKPWITAKQEDGTPVYTYGQWTSADGGKALIILNSYDWRNESYVEHEMLHDLLWRNGFKMPTVQRNVPDSVNIRLAHPVPPFERCAPTYIEQMRLLEAQRQSSRVYRP